MQKAFCHQKRRFATGVRETVITNPVLTQNDGKRILSPKRPLGFGETFITNPILTQKDAKRILSPKTSFRH